MTDIEKLHEEKCRAHSREDEGAECCDDCDETYPECGKEPEDCEQEFAENRAENDFEGRRDAYD